MRKIIGATSIRSDYDLMSGIYKALAESEDIDFKLLVSGAHLSDTFGYTVAQIRNDGLPILAEIETLLDSNTPNSRIKSASLFLQNALHTIDAFKPDLFLVVGDREDALMLATMSAYLRVPAVHFFGGDHVADGNVDTPARNAISKLVTAHFVTQKAHRQRLLRMGETPDRVFVIGNPALDRFRTEPWLSREALFSKINAPFSASVGYAVMIYHPLLGYEDLAPIEADTILRVLRARKIPTLVSVPNTDGGCRDILKVFKTFAGEPTLHFFCHLPRGLFINVLRHAEFLIGNSSLGLLEAPSIPLGSINVGMRQRGRGAAENVIFVDCDEGMLEESLRRVRSTEFTERLKKIQNPYGDGYSVDRAVKLIRTIDFKSIIPKCKDPLESTLA